MRFRHLTSAVAQILLNASSGAILKADDFLLVKAGNGRPALFNISEGIFSDFGDVSSNNFAATSDKIALSYNGNAVKIYDHSGNELANISNTSQPNFGASIQMSDTKIVISAPNDDTSGTDSGALYVYDHDGSNETKITFPGSNNDYSGNAYDRVAVGSGKIAIGSEFYPFPNTKGKVDLMDEDGSNVITIYDSSLPNSSNFGSSVYFHNDKLYISAPGSNTQKVYEYDLSGNRLRTFDSPQGGLSGFGRDLSFHGSKMAVGAEGASRCYIYDLDSESQEYVELFVNDNHTIQRSSGRPGFGQSVEFTSEFLFVGLPFESVGGVSNSGMVFQYEHDGSFVAKYDVTDFDHLNNSQQNIQIGLNMTSVPGSYPMKMFVSEGRKTYANDQKIYVMDIDGENLIELPAPEGLSQPSSSRYGDNIEVSGTNLVVIDPHGRTAYVYDLTSTDAPTSFSLDSTINVSATDHFVLEGNRLIVNRNPYGSPGRILVYNITNGNLDASFTNSDNAGFMRMDVGNDKIVATSGYGDTRKIYVYDIDDTTGSSETIITPPAPSNTSHNCNVAVGNGKIAYADNEDDNTFYIYNLDGSNEVVVDVSSASLAGYSNFGQSGQWVIGVWSMVIGNDKIVLNTSFTGVFVISDLDGSNLTAISMSNLGYSGDEYAGFADLNNGAIYVVNNKIMIGATAGRISGNEGDGIVYTFDLDGSNPKQILAPRGAESGYKFGKDIAANDPTGLTKFANLPAVISNIDASYTLTEGQDTVITAGAVDPEGDAITWSFEEVKSGTSYVVVSSPTDDDVATDSGSVYVYNANNLSAAPTKLTAYDADTSDGFGRAVLVTPDRIFIGAYGDKTDSGQVYGGAVYIYDTNNLSAQPIKLAPSDRVERSFFGSRIAVNSNKLVIGARDGYNLSSNQGYKGAIYVYDLNDLSADPIKIVEGTRGNQHKFGEYMSLNENYLAVGVPDRDVPTTNVGMVYLYDINDLSVAPIEIAPTSLLSYDSFGNDVELTSSKLFVGATGDDELGNGTGAVYVYDLNDLSAEPTKLTAFDGSTPPPGHGGDTFGEFISANDDKVVISAYRKTIDGLVYQGAAYVYDLNDLSAQATQLLVGDDGDTEFEFFGSDVAITDDHVIIGAYDDGGQRGSTFVYDLNDLSAEPTKLTAFDAAYQDRFGTKVAAISAPSALNDVTVTQSDNVFTITPGSIDSNFTLRFKVTDAAGNVTTKTSTFTYDYVNKAPIVSGIVSEYNLTQGQDTVITAVGTDPEGDAITWSFEEVTSGSYTFVQQPYWTNSGGSNIGRVVVYETSDLNTPVAYLSNPYAGVGDADGQNVSIYNGKIYVSAHGVAVGGTDNIGAVGVYDAETFEFLHNITPPDAPGNAYHYFSVDCAPIVHEGKIYIGARGWRNNKGGVYVFDETTYDHVLFIEGDEYSTGSFGSIIKIHNDILYVSQREANISGTRTGRILGYNISSFVFNNDPFLSANKLEDRDADFEITASTTQTNQYFGRTFDINDNYLVVGSAWYDEGSALSAGTIWVFDVNDSYNELTRFIPSDAIQNSMYGYLTLLTDDDFLFVSQVGLNAGKFIKYDLSGGISGLTTSAETVEMGVGNYGYHMSLVGDRLYVGAQASEDDKLYVYNTNDLSLVHTFDLESNPYASVGTASIGPSALNGVTVTQSDNVFTVTPGTADANFQLRITATDSEGNATSVTSTFGYTVPVPVVNDTSVGRIIAAASNNNYSNKLYAFDLDGSNEKELFIPAGMDNGSQFGADENMAIDGTTLVVGQRSEQRVFVYDLATTNEPIEITPPAPSNLYGTSVAISDGKIIVGTYEGASTVGAFYIYDLDGSNEIKVTEPSAGLPGAGSQNGWTKFGFKVAAGHGRIVVGAPMADADGVQDSGQVYIYDMQGTFINTISATDGQTESDQFGDYEIAIGNGKIAVAAINADGGSINSFTGSVYLYDLDGSNEVRLYDPALTGSARFGTGLAIGHEKVVVGSDNGAHFYIFDLDGSNMQKIASTGNKVITVANNRIVVGDYGKTVSESGSGELRVYDMSGNLLNTIHQSNPTNRAFLGSSLAMYDTADARAHNFAPTVSGIDAAYTLTQGQDTVITAIGTDPEGDAITWSFEEVMSGSGYVVVSAYQAEVDGKNRAGSVYVYDANDISAAPIELSAPDADVFDYLGRSVAMTSDKIFVGAEGSDPNGTDDGGAVYVFDMNDLSAQPTILSAFDGANNDKFGWTVAASSDKIVVGAPFDDDNGTSSGAVYVYDANDLSAQPTRLSPSNTDSQDKFGHNVAINSSKVFVSALTGALDIGGSAQGSVYVYDANDLSAQPVILSDAVTGDLFGGEQDRRNAISVTENMLVVGSMRYDNSSGTNVGAVYVYDTNDLSASPTRLTPFDGVDYTYFGYAVAATDDVIAVTADRYNAPRSVYVYDANDLSAQPTKISHTVTEDSFGNSLAINGNYLYVGEQADNNYKGAIYVYDLSDLSALPTKIDGVGNGSFPTFGSDIAVSPAAPSQLNGVTITQSDNVFTVTPGTADANFQLRITATDSEGNATSVTSTFAYDYVNQAPTVSGIDAAYTLTQGQDTVITASATDPEGDAITWSYEAVATGTSYVIISADGDRDDQYSVRSEAVYIYDASDLTQPLYTLENPNGVGVNDYFGNSYAIATTADKIIVGAYNDDDNGSQSGSVYVYDINDLSAAPTKLTAFDAASADFFGYSVAATANKIFVGARGDDDNGSFSGSVYVYDANDLSAQPTKLTAFDGAAGDGFGASVAATADKVIIGASNDDDNGEYSGSVYVYDANDLSAQPTKLTAFDGAAWDGFGRIIESGNGKILVSTFAGYTGPSGQASGKVYAYNEEDLSYIGAITPPDFVYDEIASWSNFWVDSMSITESHILIGSKRNGIISGKVLAYDINTLEYVEFFTNPSDGWGSSLHVFDGKIYVGAIDLDVTDNNGFHDKAGSVFVYDASDFSFIEQITESTPEVDRFFGRSIVSYSPSADLNGVTVSQSDNVFTITPGTADANFQLRITATDSEGNATSVTSDFTLDYVNQAPSVTGIESSYLLSAGGSGTAITATGTDPEGDAITWSFEEVMVAGDRYLVVADIGDNNYDGSVYIYNSSDLSETPTKLDSPAGTQNFFGRDFEIVGDKLIVTADGDDTLGNGAGAAFVYDMTDLSATPTRVTAPDGAAGNKFGYSVTSVSGKVIISSRSVPKVYVYDTNDLSTNPTILTGQTNDYGNKVTSNSNYIFVSDSTIDHGSDRAGSVYVYDINTLSLVTEIEHQAQTSAYFGRAIAANEEKLLVGGYQAGLVYVYDLNNLSSTPETTIYGPSGTAQYGISISVNDSQFVVGAKGHNSAYVYDLNNLPEYANYRDDNNPNSNFYLGQLSATNAPTSGDNFGYSVSIDDYNIVVSAYGDNDTGSVYVYDVNDLSATPTILTAFDGTAGDSFGSEIVKLFEAPDSSALNGTTVSQSDNTFTVTPGSEATSFSMRFTATDANGNGTTTTSAFTVEAAPVSTDSYYAAAAAGYPTTSGPSAYNGAVYVYDTSDISTPTLLQAPVQNQYDMYGDGVAFTDTKLIVQQKAGVYPENVKAYVYDKSDLSAAPVALDPPGGNSDERWAQGFVAGSGDKFAMSTKYDRNVGDNVQQGLIYVYDANDPSAEPVKLTSPNAHRFGWDRFAVCMTSDKLIVGTPEHSNRGSVWTYDLNNLSAAPVENISTIADVSNRFGNSISSNGSVIAIGERGAYSSQGVVHIYDVNDLSTPTSTITTGIAASGFGWVTDITDTHLFVGVPYDGNNGACYVYDLSDLSAAPIKLEGFDATSGDRFGRSVEAVGGKLFVGSAEDDPSYQSGAVYVYDLSDLSAQATKLQPAGLGSNSEFSEMVSGSE